MATWREVQERARREFTLDADDDQEFAVTLHLPSGGGAGYGAEGAIPERSPERTGGSPRAQRVMVRHYQAWGYDMIEIRSAFAQAGDFESDRLLADSLQLPLGAIAMHGRFLVLVHKACLTHLSVDGVVFLVARVSMLADVLEERRGGDRF